MTNESGYARQMTQKVYPPRLSIAELREELETYLVLRADAGLSTETVKLERQKIEHFLARLEERIRMATAVAWTG